MVTASPMYTWPVSPEVATSSDGILSGLVDNAWAGVWLKANYAGEPEVIVATNYCQNPEPVSLVGWQGSAGTIAPAPWDANRTAVKVISSGSGSPYIFSSTSPISYTAGTTVTAVVKVLATNAGYVQIHQSNPNLYFPGRVNVAASQQWQTIVVSSVLPQDVAVNSLNVALVGSAPNTAGDTYVMGDVRIGGSDYFDGGTPAEGNFDYRWTGTPNGSTSVKFIPAVPAYDPLPVAVDFVRDWDGQTVRGGDNAPCVSGISYVYDHEAKLGDTSSWYAVPVYADGTLGDPSAKLPRTIADPDGGQADPSTWIKSIESAEKSIRAMIDSWPEFTYDTDAQVSRVKGRQNALVDFDVLSGASTTAAFRTMTKEDADAFFEMANAGGVMLFQTAARYNRPSFYAVCTSITRSDKAHYWQDQITWSLELVEVDRPSAEGAMPSAPGHTFSDRLRNYPTFNDVPVRTYAEQQVL